MEPSAKKMKTEDNSAERGHYRRELSRSERDINCCGEPDDDLIVSSYGVFTLNKTGTGTSVTEHS